MISLCFFIFVLSNSATCEIWNNKLTKDFTYGSPGNPMGTVILNIDGSFRYIFGPGNNNNEDKSAEDPAAATENPATATENPATATENSATATENPATATENHATATENPATATENPNTATENPATATENPSTATENPATATENPATATENPATATENPPTATENPATATENPDTTTQRTDITTQEPGGNENNTATPPDVYDSCEDALRERHKAGVFTIQIPNSNIKPFDVYCMLDSTFDPAWTVIQCRKDGKVNFNQNWSTYESGFGDPHADYFLGLKIISELTRLKDYRLWIELVDWEESIRYARYDTFSIDNASNKYSLTLDQYDGNAGNALEDQNFQKFSTFDSDNDKEDYRNCAAEHKSGWWFKNCHQSNLNGPYFWDKEGKGIQWDTWHGMNYSLKYTHMAIQPIIKH